MHKHMYKVGEFSELIGVSISTLQRWDRDDIFKAKRTPTNQRYYTVEQLEAYKRGEYNWNK